MKAKRHDLIIRLVNENSVATQDELLQLLIKNGCNVTQATVSRDIRELSLIKTRSPSGKSHYAVPKLKRDSLENNDEMIFKILADAVVSLDYALNTVVVKCHTGMAQAVCAKLDKTGLENVVGTIAGDDTIFILMRTESDASRLVMELSTIINI